VLRGGTLVWEGTAALLRAQAPPSSYRLHTSDDARAEAVAAAHEGVQAAPRPGGELELTAAPEALDAYVLALGGHGVAVRRLEQLVGPLEAMFFLLTDEPAVTAAAVGA
jgi:ABC-2 type transport system ATP-binding protein